MVEALAMFGNHLDKQLYLQDIVIYGPSVVKWDQDTWLLNGQHRHGGLKSLVCAGELCDTMR